jgi:hypothetical protein
MYKQQKLQVDAEQKNQQDFTITQTISFDFVINATNEDEALEKFNNLELHPSEYFTFASDESFSIHSTEVEYFEVLDSESRCIIENVNSLRQSKRT